MTYRKKFGFFSDKNDDNVSNDADDGDDDINHKILLLLLLRLILFSFGKFSLNKNRWTICTFLYGLAFHLLYF